MTLTLLIDLDDTLLGNNMDDFILPYFNSISTVVKEYASSAAVTKRMVEAVSLMRANLDPRNTLKDIFDAHFYPALNIHAEDVVDDFKQFYKSDYHALQSVTQLRPEAIELIENAITRGYRIAIATNPLFPIEAVLPRLEWAGLPIETYPFELISIYDDFHFCKPNPAYYAELLAQLGWPEGPVVMVGNDKLMDIQPSEKLGLASYYVTKEEECIHSYVLDGEPAYARGWLPNVIPWLDAMPAEQLEPSFRNTEAFLAILRATPAASQTLMRSIPKEKLSLRQTADTWSLGEILCHLRDVDLEINLPRLEKILNSKDAFITAVDSDAWFEERQYQQQDPNEAFDSFAAARVQLLEKLQELDDEAWMRPAKHTIFGPTNLKELMRIASHHDRLHSRQIYETVQKIQ